MKEKSLEFVQILQNSFNEFFGEFAHFLPKLIGALILLLIGWFIARGVKWAVKRILNTLRFDELADRLEFDEFLKKGGVKTTTSGIVAGLVYWSIMLIVLSAFFDALGIDAVKDLFKNIINFIPNIIIAVIILVLGTFAADFVKNLVEVGLRNAEYNNPELIGKIVKGGIMFFVISLIMTKLNIGGELIQMIIQILLGGLGLALALAFGLGGKDWAAGVIDKYLKK